MVLGPARVLVVLGLADPAAAWAGRRWGRVRLLWGRTLEGSLTFFVVGSAAAFAALLLWHPLETPGATLLVALSGAGLGCLAELFSRRIDDNLSVPLAAAGGAWLCQLLL